MNTPPIVEIRDLHHHYPDGTHALKGISCEIREGEAIAIIGSNGAGKSTLLAHLNGTLLARQGSVSVCGERICKDNLKQARIKTGMVFQNADDQLFMASVQEDVAFGPRNMGLTPEEVSERVEKALKQVDAWDIRQKAPHNLSGGEKRAVSIATVLSMLPDIIAMDEPCSGLDPYGRRNLIKLLSGLPQTRIIATHDLDMALDLCPRSIILHDGTIAAIGDTAELFKDADLLASCRLEQPYRAASK